MHDVDCAAKWVNPSNGENYWKAINSGGNLWPSVQYVVLNAAHAEPRRHARTGVQNECGLVDFTVCEVLDADALQLCEGTSCWQSRRVQGGQIESNACTAGGSHTYESIITLIMMSTKPVNASARKGGT